MKNDRLQEAIERAEQEIAEFQERIEATPEGDEKIALQAQKKQAEHDRAAMRGEVRGVTVKAK